MLHQMEIGRSVFVMLWIFIVSALHLTALGP